MLELIVLIILIITLLGLIHFKKISIDGFTDTEEPFVNSTTEYHLESCPSGYKSFYDTDGSVLCCDGDIVANKCVNDKQCSLTGKGDKIPNCVSVILTDYAKKGETHCPPTMGAYFEDRINNLKGCTDGFLNATLNGPRMPTQATCVIYSTLDESVREKDSCYLRKKMDEASCFGTNCTKEIVSPQKNAPPLIAIHFTDREGIHRTAYTRESMESYLSITNPQWKEQGIDLSKNTSIADVAKEIFVNKSIALTK